MNTFAPIVIPTLNRFTHFKSCIESLSSCIDADKTDLFIFFDYPIMETHWDGYNKIKEYLPAIKGFKSLQVIERNENFGVVNNFFKSLEYVFERYDRLIFTEDDNMFPQSFLKFVNKGLAVFEERNDIFSICGYNYPIRMPINYKDDIYIWQGFSAWGTGIWKEKWGKLEYENRIKLQETIKLFLSDESNVKLCNSISGNYVRGLNRIVETGHIIGDTMVSYHQIVNGMYSVFPKISRVRNTGHDGSGEHGGVVLKDTYRSQKVLAGDCNYEMPVNIKPNKKIDKVLYNHFRTPLSRKMKDWILKNLFWQN